MRKVLGVGFLILLVLLIIFGGPLFRGKLLIDSSISRLGRSGLGKHIAELEAENEFLRKQLYEEDAGVGSIKVYSSYPFNSRSEIAIAAGSEDGINIGDVVVVAGDTLVGSVTRVFKSSSIVTTIFDASWEMAVRIGDSEVDALMRGGNKLTLSLIPKDEYIEAGEPVVSAGKGFPYGLKLGSVGSIDEASGDVFQGAVVSPAFQVKDLRNVAIYR